MFLSNKKIIILFISVFLLFVVGTIGLIYLHEKKKTNEVISSDVVFVDVKPASIHDSYFLNGIEIVKKIELYEKNGEYITGLKNRDVQKKINDKIDLVINQLGSEVKEFIDSGYKDVKTSLYAYGNFNNVLSLEIRASVLRDTEDSFDYKTFIEYINVYLVDGNDISFDSLFTKKGNDVDFVRIAAYSAIAKKYSFNCLDENGELDYDSMQCFMEDSRDLSRVEDEVMLAVNYYKSDNFKFYFSPTYIYFETPNMAGEQNFYEYRDMIGIYNRVNKIDDLYEKKNLNNEYIAFTNSYDNLGYPSFALAKNNNIILSVYESGMYPEVKVDDVKKRLDNFVNDSILGFKNNEGGYLQINFTVYYNSKLNLLTMNCDFDKYVSSLTYFKETMYEDLIKAFNSTDFYGYYLGDASTANYTYSTNRIREIYMGSKKIEKLSDLFKSDYDYESIIKNKINTQLYNGIKTEEEMADILKKYEVEIDYDNLFLKYFDDNDWQQNLSINYDEFDQRMFMD